MAGMTNPTLGISIAVAIAIHNIPEGLAVSVPIYYATGSKKRPLFFPFFLVCPNQSALSLVISF